MKKSIIQFCLQNSLKFNTVDKHPQFDCYKHYSYLIQNNSVIEWGLNRSGPPPVGYYKFQKIHSEFNCYSKARGLLDKQKPFQIINLRMNKQGNLKLSKPCKCCVGFLRTVGCSAVYFSTGIVPEFAKLTL